MVEVLETMQLNNGKTVLVCKMFSDENVTDKVKIGDTIAKNFSIEQVRACFSAPKTRDIVVVGAIPSNTKFIEFV
jgi:hypothetical protein